jgi:osmotically-inducible protein OsmY
MKKYLPALALAAMLTSLPALANKDLKGEARDAWITGKIETIYLLNAHLDGFTIDTDVRNGAVHLTGKVESSIDRDLAAELARGVDGVTSVQNDLVIDAKGARTAMKGGERSFSGRVADATTTAEVKSKLLANSNTHGMKIDVDTRGDVVTLTGTVASAEEKQLAEQLARNTRDVKGVNNRLAVRGK